MKNEKVMPKRMKQILQNFADKIQSTLFAAAEGKGKNTDIGNLTIWNIASLVRFTEMALDEEYKKASYLMFDISTSTRDCIPRSIFNWLEKHYSYKNYS